MVKLFSWRSLLLGGVLLCASPLAVAQDAPDAGDAISSREGIALQNQLAAIRQQLTQLQNTPSLAAPSATGSAPSIAGGANGDLTAQLLQRVSALEEQNRQMRGELDQLSNTLQTTQANLSKQISDMQFAAQNGGSGAASSAAAGSLGAAAGAAAATPAAKDDATAAPADTAPKTALEALHQGNAALHAGRYADAESDARFAVKTAKSVPGRMDAQFLLAQSLAGQKQYRESAVAYYDAYGKAPKSAKAQDSLLGVAASLLALGDKPSACQALDKLKAEFPSPEARVKAAETTFRTRAACH
ncbi:hypothetical protein AA106555_1170 [Neokomagataea thailandica NBRC 106555]|uniref:Cell division coordinator CpoB n=2 Tax=Neokomagataea TaxID=1223423 RepID=A0A4Y6V8V7_9PROT|nr:MULTISPECIES: tetratricopeptide repeat protein [Neokomagataea]QDH25784.1 hypothetical protein D5366_02465 [Neokomagataea tanensis]GBR53101.1 hypothetical protein AA106555_1170 [Neokomagataea thailandica NBRC 106555]